MNARNAIILTVLLMLSGCTQQSLGDNNEPVWKQKSEHIVVENGDTGASPTVVTFDRRIEPIVNTQGLLITEMHADKLIVLPTNLSQRFVYEHPNQKANGYSYTDELKALKKVNDYFETECNAFFDGDTASEHFKDGYMNGFSQLVFQREELFGEDHLLSDSFWCNMQQEVTYFDGHILSVCETVDHCAGGISSLVEYGITFNLQTGERMSLDCFISTDLETFKSEIVDMFCDQLIEWGYSNIDQASDLHDSIEELFSSYTFDDFQFSYTGDRIILFLPVQEHGLIRYRIEYAGQHLILP